jgi:hypothetical protein
MYRSMPVDKQEKHRFSEDEVRALKELYAESGRLMVWFDLSKKKVFGWFQNRRGRERREERKDNEN